jgi:hypothetical protein
VQRSHVDGPGTGRQKVRAMPLQMPVDMPRIGLQDRLPSAWMPKDHQLDSKAILPDTQFSSYLYMCLLFQSISV